MKAAGPMPDSTLTGAPDAKPRVPDEEPALTVEELADETIVAMNAATDELRRLAQAPPRPGRD